jgi:Mn2+/Fe2+ NRAMP family transporter
VFAQSVTIFLVPFIGIAMYAIANDAHVMGPYKNSLMVKISGGVGLLLIIGLAFVNVNQLFFK